MCFKTEMSRRGGHYKRDIKKEQQKKHQRYLKIHTQSSHHFSFRLINEKGII